MVEIALLPLDRTTGAVRTGQFSETHAMVEKSLYQLTVFRGNHSALG